MQELKAHAIREFHRNEDDDDYRAEEIRTIGYCVVDGGLTPDELQLIRDKIDRIYAQQVAEIGGEDRLCSINDADIARCLLAYDDYFVGLATHPRLLGITRRLLGDNFTLMSQNGIINRPIGEHYQATWHRDLNYQHFVSSRPLAVSALFCIDDFSEETGGTRLLPATHKVEAFPSEDYVRRHDVGVEAPAGSILLFDAMVFHRTGNNRSGRVRRGVNHIFTLPLIRQQISLPSALAGRFADDPLLSRLLGYAYESGANVKQWRENKLQVTRAAG